MDDAGTSRAGVSESVDHVELTDEFREALALLNSGESLFLTGKAGTGKSTLVRYFMATSERQFIVAAPTGVAALNVDGYTIHRLFGFPANVTVDQVRSGDARPGRFMKALRTIDTLIIDEASMIRADLFDCIAVALELYGPQPGQRFGGVQLVLVGDLFQLPPVVVEEEEAYFETTYASPYFFSATNFDQNSFPAVQLTRVFRQQAIRNLWTPSTEFAEEG